MKTSELSDLVEQWLGELSRSIEMFTGKRAELTADSSAASPPSGERLTWRGQVLSASGKQFSIWVGASQATLAALHLADGTEPVETFGEIVSQANQSFAAELGNSYGLEIRCSNEPPDALPAAAPQYSYHCIANRLDGADFPPMIAAIDNDMLAVLEPGVAPASASAGSALTLAPVNPRGNMLGRLMDLELPLSVTLGRATLPIRDVLKLTSGSLIELDRTSAEYVDLVVHGTVVARGEVVSVKGNYGVRVREIISREDRMALQARA